MIQKQVIKQINSWREQNSKIILVTGIFDLLHIEHIRFLNNAKKAGNRLIVGIETDQQIKKIKGGHRPVNYQLERLEQLNALKSVDLSFLLPKKFDTQADWEKLIKDLKPDIYAVSSHTSFLENKKKIVEKHDCQLQIVHQFNPEYSTSKLHRKLLKEL